MPLQEWIHHWEEGAGARLVKLAVALLAFIALASLYDLMEYEGQVWSSEEAMENAQLARNLSQGKGYTTDSIRPLTLYLLASAAEPGQSSKVLAQRVPDLSNAPAYPFLLAGLMKALPFHFAAKQFWSYEPEEWIGFFNQALFFAAVVALFFLARRLFDSSVAWLSAALFAGTELFWRFSVSGLSTLWLILVLLGVVLCMTTIESLDRAATAGAGGKSIFLALLTGALAGVGGLTRYAFAWMIVPVILFVWLSVTRGRGKLCLAIAASFLAVMAPWLARNISLSGHCFGTADYAVVQETTSLPDNTLERSADPRGEIMRLAPADVVNKFFTNAREFCLNEAPRLGGNWISAFFLAGLLIPFRNAGLTRLRWFLVGSLILLFVVQALGQTHVSSDAPRINSENLLVLLAPLVFIYGAAMFHTLLDQLDLPLLDVRGLAATGFVAVMCAPLLLTLLAPRDLAVSSPYSPLHIQRTARLLQTNEMMTSDIPAGVAWYGGRSCVWLPLDDENEFFKVNALKPVHALFLTQVTTDERFLTQIKANEKSWGHFLLQCSEHGEVPTGFPLRKAPKGFLPDQLFLSDKVRWQDTKTRP
ncbi:MAG: ArnT family glycosyltransferase [Limisphaerales bacterium]